MNVQPGRRPGDSPLLTLSAAAAAAIAKTYIASATLGTNDVVAFYQFAKAMHEHSLTWLYMHSILFNHPPLVGYYLQGILSIDCVLGTPPAGAGEGITLDVHRGPNFDRKAAGCTLFILDPR